MLVGLCNLSVSREPRRAVLPVAYGLVRNSLERIVVADYGNQRDYKKKAPQIQSSRICVWFITTSPFNSSLLANIEARPRVLPRAFLFARHVEQAFLRLSTSKHSPRYRTIFALLFSIHQLSVRHSEVALHRHLRHFSTCRILRKCRPCQGNICTRLRACFHHFRRKILA